MRTAWRRFGLVLCLAIQCVLGQAQVNTGLKGGMTSASFTGRDVTGGQQTTSMLTGVFVNIAPGKFLSLQPELLLLQKGAAFVRNDMKETYRINYMEVPLLFKLQFPLGRIVYPNIYFGPYYAQKLSNTYTALHLDEGTAYQTDELNFKNNDYGSVAGAGLDIRGEILFLTLDARYGWGLNTIDKGNNNTSPDVRNRCLMLSAGIGIHFH